jgi:type III pantothenate kinase
MNAVIDIGNSRIKVGFYNKNVLAEQLVWESWNLQKFKTRATNHSIQNVILCNVGKVIPTEIEKFLQSFFFIELNSKTPLPIQMQYKTPETLGKDRIAAVVGAFDLFANENCLVMDAGTCITYEILTEEGVYLGGNIAPGLAMRLQAMHHFTAKLPQVEVGETESWIGYSTVSAMQNGAQLGLILEIEGFIGRCRREWENLNVILTGGDAAFLAKYLDHKNISIQPNLVLQGLNKILNYNVEL